MRPKQGSRYTNHARERRRGACVPKIFSSVLVSASRGGGSFPGALLQGQVVPSQPRLLNVLRRASCSPSESVLYVQLHGVGLQSRSTRRAGGRETDSRLPRWLSDCKPDGHRYTKALQKYIAEWHGMLKHSGEPWGHCMMDQEGRELFEGPKFHEMQRCRAVKEYSTEGVVTSFPDGRLFCKLRPLYSDSLS